MDIEERAGKWAREFVRMLSTGPREVLVDQDALARLEQLFTEAYLAGVAQAQRDYVAYCAEHHG